MLTSGNGTGLELSVFQLAPSEMALNNSTLVPKANPMFHAELSTSDKLAKAVVPTVSSGGQLVASKPPFISTP